MPSVKPQIKAVIEEGDYNKIKYIAEKEHRTISNLLQTMVKEKIEAYEQQHGEIKPGE